MALMSDPVIQAVYCIQDNHHCSIDNMKVYCSNVKKRSTGTSSNQIHITFEFKVQDKSPSADQNVEMSKMSLIARSLAALSNEVCILHMYLLPKDVRYRHFNGLI